MLIAVLSDLHLGLKNPLDRFARGGHAERRFIRLLTHLERSVDRIVLLGDVFETLRGPKPGSSQSQLREVMATYPEIARRATEDRRYQLVQGNHDFVVTRVLGTPAFHHIKTGSTRLVFFHGHQLDWVARGGAPLSRLGVWMGGMLERMGVYVTKLIDRSGRVIVDGGMRPERVHKVERAALALGKSLGADVVVNGHTHRATKVELGDQLYLNSGACLAGRREMLLIDTQAHRFDVVRESEIG